MELFRFIPTGKSSVKQRETQPALPSGVPTTTAEEAPKPVGGDYAERIAYVRGPEQALSVATVYQAVRLRSDVMSVMPVQYQKRDFEKGNYYVDMRGIGRRYNYLLQQEPNPLMSAPDLWRMVEVNRLLFGNAFVYIERDEFDFPVALWLVKSGGFNVNTGRYIGLVYLSDHGYVIVNGDRGEGVPREDVLHFPNSFRYQNGIWGIPTLQYAIETLSLNRTLRQQSLETAAKGGRVKGFISEDRGSSPQGTLAAGRYNKQQAEDYASEIQKKLYSGHDILAIQGLEKFTNIQMSAVEMQMFEQMGATNDDVARFFGVPRPLLILDTNSHYNDYQNATMEFHTRTILPQKNANEKEVARKLIGFRDYGVHRIHICEDPLMVMDPERRAKVALMKLQAAIATPNEIRSEFDMPTIEDGDTPMASANLLSLKALLAKGEPSTTLQPGSYIVPSSDQQGDGGTDDKNKNDPKPQNG